MGRAAESLERRLEHVEDHVLSSNAEPRSPKRERDGTLSVLVFDVTDQTANGAAHHGNLDRVSEIRPRLDVVSHLLELSLNRHQNHQFD